MIGEMPRRLVLDAGPLIALLYADDRDHSAAVHGFRQLARGGTRLLAPLPIVFEVYKWLLYETNLRRARDGLAHMRRGTEIVYPEATAIDQVTTMLTSMPAWGGSLEDALVAI